MLEEITCWVCGIRFGAPRTWLQRRRENGEGFRCPNGDSIAFGPSELDKMRQERDRLQQRIAQKDDDIAWQKEQRQYAERRVTAAKGQITRLRKRANAGVCPCCNRTFANMARHMKTMHPDHDPNVIDLGAEKAKRA